MIFAELEVGIFQIDIAPIFADTDIYGVTIMAGTISEKIKICRDKAGKQQKDLAKFLDVSIDTVWRWENDKGSPSLLQAQKIATFLNTSVAFLVDENQENKVAEIQRLKNQVVVPVYSNITPHCGDGKDNGDVTGELEQYLPLPAEYVGTDDVKNVYGLYVEGNSMEAARIADGDIAIIRRCDDWYFPGYGDPCYVQYERDGFTVDAIKFYYPRRDGSAVTLRSAEGSGVRELTFEGEDLKNGNPLIRGVVVGVVEFHKPVKGR